jgi:LmbE family N-acetylglucosaminyl deacetylase
VTRRLAALVAHPDDDAFGIGGTLALHAGDAEAMVVFATSGDAGRIADDSLATRETLGAVRESEAAAAYGVLGIPADLRFLRHPDGHVAEVPHEDLVASLGAALEVFRPQVVVTFGPDGITGHEDHVAVGIAATEAFHLARQRDPGGPGRPPALLRLLHLALAEADLGRLSDELVRRGLEPPDPSEPFQPRGVPDSAIGVRVDCSGVIKRKLAALREHRTQAQDLDEFPQDLWPEVLSSETFVAGWPQRRDGDPVLSDVFEGLPSP